MMKNRHYRTGVTSNIFGSYVMNMRQVPGREEKNDAEAKERAKTQKEINRQKLAEARKRDAEKYGDTYTEVTDDDLE